MYHFLAVNLLEGKGYYEGPVDPSYEYGPKTHRLFPDMTPYVIDLARLKSRPGPSRVPIYPLFLTLIYSIHGVNPDAVLYYQIGLTAAVGALLVLLGHMLWGGIGAVCGLLACFLLGMDRAAAYPCSQLLTECLTGFLLTGAAVLAAWAKRGRLVRECAVGTVLATAILTRPAVIFVAVIYGAFLVLECWRAKKARIAAYALPCVILLGSWSCFASLWAGRPLLLTCHGGSNLVAGIDPRGAAVRLGREPVPLEPAALNAFWRRFPGGQQLFRGEAMKTLLRAPSRWREILRLTYIKLRIVSKWFPGSLWVCMCLGTVLVAVVKPLARCEDSGGTLPTTTVAMGGRKKRLWVFYAALALLLWLTILGYSHPAIHAICVVLPLAAPFCGVAVPGVGGVRPQDDEAPLPYWFMSWHLGFLTLTVVFFGIHRFVRPFLPIYYLSAAMAIPLLAAALGALSGRPILCRPCSDEGDQDATPRQ